MEAKYKQLARAVQRLVGDDDAFGLARSNHTILGNVQFQYDPTHRVIRPLTVNAPKWQFLNDPGKVAAYQAWLKSQVDAGILASEGGLHDDKPWLAEYIESAHKQGAVRAFADTRKLELSKVPGYKGQSQDQFIRDAFGGPAEQAGIALLYGRAYDGLKGVTAAMGADMSRILAAGFAHGSGPNELAKQLVKATGISQQRAMTLARTELAHAYAEGQLDSFDKLDVPGLMLMAEWSTAGDDHVCPLCAPLEGSILTVAEARGLIPRHPNCRCAWLPANVGETKQTQQKWSDKALRKAFGQSVTEETGLDGRSGQGASRWLGAAKTLLDKAGTEPTPADKAKKTVAMKKALADKAAAEAEAKALADALAAKAKLDAAKSVFLAQHGLAATAVGDDYKFTFGGYKDVTTKLGVDTSALTSADTVHFNLLVDYHAQYAWLQAKRLEQDAVKKALAEAAAKKAAEEAAAKKLADEQAAQAKKAADAKAHSDKIKAGMQAAKDKKAAVLEGLKGAYGVTDDMMLGSKVKLIYLEKISGQPFAALPPKAIEELKALSKKQAGTIKEQVAILHSHGALGPTLAAQLKAKEAELVAATKPKPPAKLPPERPVQPAGLPDPADIRVIKQLPGSTRPNLVKDTNTGLLWVEKAGLDPGHVRSEALADELYRRGGLAVPKSGIVETAEGPVKFSQYLPNGQTLAEWQTTAKPAELKAMRAQISQGFVLDALLANHDVAGLGNDNIFISGGTAYRIDNGGALAYRAQGGQKQGFGVVVSELATLRDKKKNPNTAAIYADLTDDQIHDQIRDLLNRKGTILAAVKDKELHKTLEARIDYLAAQLPPPAEQPKGQTTAEYGVSKGTAKRVGDARLNGRAFATDRGDVEDINGLAWGTADAKGNPQTHFQFKVTERGSKSIELALGDKLTNLMKTAASTSVGGDPQYTTIVSAAKTISTHAKDGNYNKQTLDKLAVVKKELLKSKDPKAQHYLDAIAQLEEAKNKSQPAPKIDQYVPPSLAQPTGAGVKVTPGDISYNTNNIKDGSARGANGVNAFGGAAYKLDMGDGVQVHFVPRTGDTQHKMGLAFEGTVRITVPEAISNETLQKALGTAKAMGLDLKPPTPEYEELLYLYRTIYLRGDADKAAYKKIWEGSQSDTAKIKDVKQWVQSNYSISLPDKPTGDYNPQGRTMDTFGNGVRVWERWDLPVAKVQSEMSNYRLVHTAGGGSFDATKDALSGILQSGGQFTCTTERARRGVDINKTGGMSSSTDVTTGGASYFFTRIREQGKLPKVGFIFKPDALARDDAITYTGDKYGSVNKVDERKASIADYKAIAARGSSDETIFKNALGLQDLHSITVETAAQRQQMIQVFKDNKIEKLPDGRSVEDVVVSKK